MGFISWIKGAWSKMFLKREAKEVFGIDIADAGKMNNLYNAYYDITSGNPPWADEEDGVDTINFAQFVDDFTSGLVTLDLDIQMPEGQRGEYLQKIANYMLEKLDEKVSDALGNAGIMFKANGTNVDYFYPGNFLVTESDSNGNILGCMFPYRKYDASTETFYTRYEWHRFENGIYRISNAVFKSKSKTQRGEPCDFGEVTEWAMLQEECAFDNIEKPLFAYYANPKPNFIDRESPMRLPIWGNAVKELKDLDIAWSRKGTEVEDSKHMTLLPETAIQYANQKRIRLPRFFKGTQTGNVNDNTVHEHVATMLTEQRIADINSILSMISTKIGYDQGIFTLDEKNGVVTATQIEADDQTTIRTIKNLRDPLKDCILQVLYGAAKMADIYGQSAPEKWTNSFESMRDNIVFNFGDITYSYEEDKANWWKYRVQGDVPPYVYYMKFEGYSEDEARAMIEEAQAETPKLFDEE